jgi:hypothetical protein
VGINNVGENTKAAAFEAMKVLGFRTIVVISQVINGVESGLPLIADKAERQKMKIQANTFGSF